MSMKAEDIKSMILAALPGASIDLVDTRGDEDHYSATIIAEQFRGKSKVQQHQMVYSALGGRMGGELHALALQTSAPE